MDAVADFSSERIEGMTAIGHMRFSAPLFTQITPFLWMGGSPDTYTPPSLPPSLDAILNLYVWAKYKVPSGVEYKEETMYDTSEGSPDSGNAWALAAWAFKRVKSGRTTLIHCQAGLNRSGLITGMVMMLMGWTAEEAIAEMRKRRSNAVLINPAFEQFLLDINPGDITP